MLLPTACRPATVLDMPGRWYAPPQTLFVLRHTAPLVPAWQLPRKCPAAAVAAAAWQVSLE